MTQHGRYTRLGMISELEQELEGIEAELKNLSEGIGDRLLALRSHLDTDGKAMLVLANKYYELQTKGRDTRRRLEELKAQ